MKRLLILALALPLCGFSPLVQRAILDPQVSPIASNTGFAPSTLGSTLKARWNADSPSAGTVTTWTDSVASIALTNAGTPTKSATSWPGATGGAKAGITFNGTTDVLSGTSFAALPTGANGSEIFLEAQNNAAASTTAANYGGTTAGTRRILNMTSAGAVQVTDGTAATTLRGIIGSSPFVADGIFTATTDQARVNGQGSTPAAITLNTGTARFAVGASNAASPSGFMSGVVREVDVTGPLTATQRQEMEAWLAWDGGSQTILPFNHPFRFRRP